MCVCVSEIPIFFPCSSITFCLIHFDSLFIYVKDRYVFFLENWPLSLCNGPLYPCVKDWYSFFKYSTKYLLKPVKPSGLWEDLKMTNSISLLVIGLFIFLFLLESLLVICLFTNVFISSKLYN